MKLIFAEEDSVFGLITGAFIIGLSGLYYGVSFITDIAILPPIIFGIALLLTVLDFFYTLTYMFESHIVVNVLAIINIFIDLVIEAGFLVYFTKWQVPILSNYIEYLGDPQIVLYLGVFTFVTSAIWLIVIPLTY